MTDFEMYDHVKIKENNATGFIVDIESKDDKTYYCIEYDEDYQYLDEDMGIVYLTKDKIEKIEGTN